MIRIGHKILPPTAQRIFLHTCPDTNTCIRNRTLENLTMYRESCGDILSGRVEQLNYEWDTERVIEAKTAAVVLLSSVLGLKCHRAWFLLTAVSGGFLLQHALQGWSPAMPLIRKFGVRTAEEIYNEKTALKMQRGDFAEEAEDASQLLNAAEKE